MGSRRSAADHRPRASGAVRLPVAGEHDRRRRGLAAQGAIRSAQDPRGRRRAGRDQRDPPRAARRADRSPRGGRHSRAGPARALGRGALLLDRLTRVALFCSRSGTARGCGGASTASGWKDHGSGRSARERHERFATCIRRQQRVAGADGGRQLAALELLETAASGRRERRRRRSCQYTASKDRGRGLLTLASEVSRRPAIERIGAVGGRVQLSAPQLGCVRAIVAALDGDGARERLLHGVTGSGKTEVYLAAIEAALERGRAAILLVPEIGLTPQTLGRVAARLGDRVACSTRGVRWAALRRWGGCARGRRASASAPLGGLTPAKVRVDRRREEPILLQA